MLFSKCSRGRVRQPGYGLMLNNLFAFSLPIGFMFFRMVIPGVLCLGTMLATHVLALTSSIPKRAWISWIVQDLRSLVQNYMIISFWAIDFGTLWYFWFEVTIIHSIPLPLANQHREALHPDSVEIDAKRCGPVCAAVFKLGGCFTWDKSAFLYKPNGVWGVQVCHRW